MIRRIILSVTAFLLLSVMLFSVSCALDREDATELIVDFFDAIEDKDYKEAEKLLHPDYKRDLGADFAALEERYGLPLNPAFDIDEDTFAYRVHYSEMSDIPGATYTREYRLTFNSGAHGNMIEISASVLKNDNGYGIYDMTIMLYTQD